MKTLIYSPGNSAIAERPTQLDLLNRGLHAYAG